MHWDDHNCYNNVANKNDSDNAVLIVEYENGSSHLIYFYLILLLRFEEFHAPFLQHS